MKKLAFAAFIAFWSVIATLLALAMLAPPASEPAVPATADGPPSISLAEFTRHASPGDCWLAIEGRVFDVTEYVGRHPAPREVLTAWCGREASAAMRGEGDVGETQHEHSARAWRLLDRYHIGALEEDPRVERASQ
ncbi:MAG: cytochrome b5-like heme/steroid binding domain-containing protein [Wenzhouxiangellaceae bacterium]|nr:cytochrome b5-like heme/steroid binding domain-containing protein [Wenzhouxiangellaceae bacterium]